MNIKTIIVGSLKTNCYLVEKENKVIIIDPGAEFTKIDKEIKNKSVLAVFITHNHFDHIGALKDITNKYSIPINPEYIPGFKYEIIKTPGHSKDSITIYFEKEKIMFTGDFIFKNDIGATHFIGGDTEQMIQSLKKIKKYPKEIICYPGHGEKTNLGIVISKY